jgi:hypothetical protein
MLCLTGQCPDSAGLKTPKRWLDPCRKDHTCHPQKKE